MSLAFSPRARFGVFATIAASLISVIALSGWSIVHDYTDTYQRAEERTQKVAHLLEEHASGTIHAAVQVLQRAAEIAGAGDLAKLRQSRDDWERLHALAESLPRVGAIWIQDADGNGILGSSAFPTPDANVSERSYFKAHRDGERFVIDTAIKGATTGKTVFTISRRLDAEDGSFRGVVLTALYVDYFTQLYEAASLGPGATVAMYQPNGGVIVRYPDMHRYLGKSASTSRIFRDRVPRVSQDTFTNISVLDGIERLLSYRVVKEFPVVVIASVTTTSIREEWLSRIVWTAVLAGIAAATLIGCGWLTLRGLRAAETAHFQVADANRRLGAALSDKEVLFREVHHRVKNNLQTVSSLLFMQIARVHDTQTKALLQATLGQVEAMGLVHRVLYQSDQAAEVDLRPYLEQLCADLSSMYDASGRGIVIRVEVNGCTMPMERAIPVGLVVNEVVTNAYKHAFPDGRKGQVTVTCAQSKGRMVLTVRDDGVGLAGTVAQGTSIGMDLIHSLVEQAGGQCSFEEDGGIVFRLELPTADETVSA